MAGRANIGDLEISYEVSHRDVKYPRLEYKTGQLLLVLPKGTDEDEILERHHDWIYKRSQDIRTALDESKKRELVFERAEEEFRDLVLSFADEISEELDLKINKIFFRRMKSKWGSCSAKKNLTINRLMRHLPRDLIEYVIYHEMVHLIEKRHNEKFWTIVSSRFNNHQKYEKDLLVYWFLIQGMVEPGTSPRAPSKRI